MNVEERKELIDLMMEEMEYESKLGVVSTEWILSTLINYGVNQ